MKKERLVGMFIIGLYRGGRRRVRRGRGKRRRTFPLKASRNRNSSSAESLLVSDLVEGRKVFEAKNCSQCHSIFERERKAGPQSARFYGVSWIFRAPVEPRAGNGGPHEKEC